MSSINIHEASDYSLIAVVAFIIVAAIVMAYCQKVQREESNKPFILSKRP